MLQMSDNVPAFLAMPQQRRHSLLARRGEPTYRGFRERCGSMGDSMQLSGDVRLKRGGLQLEGGLNRQLRQRRRSSRELLLGSWQSHQLGYGSWLLGCHKTGGVGHL